MRCLFWRATATVVDPFKWRAERLPYNLKEKSALRSAFATEENLAVVADGFDRATFHRFFAARFFLRILCLFVNVGMSTVIVALEICRRGFAAHHGTNRSRYTGRRRKISRGRFPGIYLQDLPCFVLIGPKKTVRRNDNRRNGICLLP